MIFDALLILSGAVSPTTGALTGQTVTGTDTTVLSTNTIDVGPLALGGNQNTDMGSGDPLQVAIRVMVAASGGTSWQAQVIHADDAALTSNVQVLGQSGAIPIASMTAGTQIVVPLTRVAPFTAKRYLGLRYVLVGAVSAGAYVAGIVEDAQSPNTPFRAGWSVT